MIRSRALSRFTRLFPQSSRLLLLGLLCAGGLACDSHAESGTRPTFSRAASGIWISREELRALPMSGPAWDALVAQANTSLGHPNVSDQNDPNNVRVLAKAIYFARTGEERYAREVAKACRDIQGSERNADTLALGRELVAYVVAADLVQLDGADASRFKNWLRRIGRNSFRGRTIRSTHEDRPNNWGTHAGATRIAIAVYLDDQREIERAAHVFRGWTGEEDGWRGFEYGARWWQVEASRPMAVNPVGALREGHPIGGVLPDDQRRAGHFKWPPSKENYVYEALQGAVSQAVMLERLGYTPWEWGDRALLRAFEWLHSQAHFPATGDDTWLPHVINRAYGTGFPAPIPSTPGKGMGFSGWTHTGRPSP